MRFDLLPAGGFDATFVLSEPDLDQPVRRIGRASRDLLRRVLWVELRPGETNEIDLR